MVVLDASIVDNQCITMGYGQAGVTIMNQYWESICNEFNVGLDGTLNYDPETSFGEINRMFCEYSSGKFVPRCIFIDTEPTPCEHIMNSSNMKNLYGKNLFAYGKQDAKNIFACGFYGKPGLAIQEDIEQKFRQQHERCNVLSEVGNYFSVCGGTGSGVAARISQSDLIDHKNINEVTFALYPSNKLSNNCVEPYNVLLNIYASRLNGMRFIFDNAALYRNLSSSIKSPTYHHANQYITKLAKTFNVCSNKGNSAAASYHTNLIPYPRLNTLIAGFSTGKDVKTSCAKYCITNSFHYSSISYQSQRLGKNLGAALIFRGNFNRYDIDSSHTYTYTNFAKFAPFGYMKILCPKLPRFLDNSIFTFNTKKIPESTLALFANNTIVGDVLTDVITNADLLLSNRCFLHWYLKEGMEELEILDARMEVDQSIDDYKMINLADGAE